MAAAAVSGLVGPGSAPALPTPRAAAAGGGPPPAPSAGARFAVAARGALTGRLAGLRALQKGAPQAQAGRPAEAEQAVGGNPPRPNPAPAGNPAGAQRAAAAGGNPPVVAGQAGRGRGGVSDTDRERISTVVGAFTRLDPRQRALCLADLARMCGRELMPTHARAEGAGPPAGDIGRAGVANQPPAPRGQADAAAGGQNPDAPGPHPPTPRKERQYEDPAVAGTAPVKVLLGMSRQDRRTEYGQAVNGLVSALMAAVRRARRHTPGVRPQLVLNHLLALEQEFHVHADHLQDLEGDDVDAYLGAIRACWAEDSQPGGHPHEDAPHS